MGPQSKQIAKPIQRVEPSRTAEPNPMNWAISGQKAETRDERGKSIFIGQMPLVNATFRLQGETIEGVARRRRIITGVDIVPADTKKIEEGTFVYIRYGDPNVFSEQIAKPFFGKVKKFIKDELGLVKAIVIYVTHQGRPDFTRKQLFELKTEGDRFEFESGVGYLRLHPYEQLIHCKGSTKTIALENLVVLEPVIVAIRDVDRVVNIRSPRVIRRTELNMGVDSASLSP